VLDLFRSLKKNRRLLTDLVSRDLRARYVGSSMGFFWSIVFPLINLFVYQFVFTKVLRARWSETQSDEEVALLMLSGIIVWQSFAETVSRSTNTLVENQNLIQKVVFPSEILPVYLVLSSLINMLIGMAITLLGVAWFAWIHPPVVLVAGAVVASAKPLGFGITLLAIPILMGLQACFTLGIGYTLSAFNLFLRDVYHLIGVVLSVFMFMTPIFYPAKLVKERGFEWVLQINPMYWLIDSYRSVLLYGQWPKLPVIASFAAVALVVLSVGITFFMRQKPRFPDLL